MPRPKSPNNAAHQFRQARYRERLRQRGCPEASHVDIAVAEAVAVAVSAAARDGKLDPDGVLAKLMREAVRRLAVAGYDRNEVREKARQRLGRFGHHVPPGMEA